MADEYKKPESPEQAAMELHEWLFKPQMGYASRSIQLDAMMKVMRGGKFSARMAIWFGGCGLAVIGAYNTVSAFIIKTGGGPPTP